MFPPPFFSILIHDFVSLPLFRLILWLYVVVGFLSLLMENALETFMTKLSTRYRDSTRP